MIRIGTLVDWWLSLFVSHWRCIGNVGGDEDFPWREQPISFCFSIDWICADTAVWIYNLGTCASVICFSSPPTVGEIQGLLCRSGGMNMNSGLLFCLISLLSMSVLINIWLPDMSLELCITAKMAAVNKWNVKNHTFHIRLREIQWKTAYADLRQSWRYRYGVQQNTRVCSLTSRTLPLTCNMCLCWPWRLSDQWSNDCEAVLGQWTSQLKSLWSANWLHLSFSSSWSPKYGRGSFALVKLHL